MDATLTLSETGRFLCVLFQEKLWRLRQPDFDCIARACVKTDTRTDSWKSKWSLSQKLSTPTSAVNHWAQPMKQTPIRHHFLLPVRPPLSLPHPVYLPPSPLHLSPPFCLPPLPARLRTAPPPSAPSSPGWALFVWASLPLCSQDSRPRAGHSSLRLLSSPPGTIEATPAPLLLYITHSLL